MNRLLLRGAAWLAALAAPAALALAQAAQVASAVPETVERDARSRVAFVIGNRAFQGADGERPVLSARSMAQALRDAGFTVTLLEYVTDRQMRRAFEEFAEGMPERARAVVYFAGRGGVLSGRLVPFPADVHPLGIPPSIDLERWMAQLAATPIAGALRLIDAGFVRQTGEEPREVRVPPKTMLACALPPGRPQNDEGWFTEGLLETLRDHAPGAAELLERTR